MIEILDRPAPAEPISPIKPSQAIRLGCLVYPRQGFGDMLRIDRDGVEAACALGALAAGYGWRGRFSGPSFWLLAPQVEAFRSDAPCPVGCAQDSRHVIAHLNDIHRWTREAIADWLEGLGW